MLRKPDSNGSMTDVIMTIIWLSWQVLLSQSFGIVANLCQKAKYSHRHYEMRNSPNIESSISCDDKYPFPMLMGIGHFQTGDKP